ncbi:MAG: response regulator transcription factor [Chloroflexi bacterium]|nr:response regulator transcription factor [Chloroflexota bacterium]
MTTVLVVDDQSAFCELVKEFLAASGEFQVVAVAHDGTTALRLVEELKPDVVLLDVEMPGMHGLKVAARIHAGFPAVKVILMSAYHRSEYRQEALRAGAWDFIPKAEFSAQRLKQVLWRETPG